jgi:hypothetical protein
MTTVSSLLSPSSSSEEEEKTIILEPCNEVEINYYVQDYRIREITHSISLL